MERHPNVIGQIYRLPEMTDYLYQRYKTARLREGDLIICLKHTGDCHYSWGRLLYTTQTRAPFNQLPVHVIKNYYDIDLIFSAYSANEEWAILQEPLSESEVIGALVAMHQSGTTGILLPLNTEDTAEYLRRQEEHRNNVRVPTAEHLDEFAKGPQLIEGI